MLLHLLIYLSWLINFKLLKTFIAVDIFPNKQSKQATNFIKLMKRGILSTYSYSLLPSYLEPLRYCRPMKKCHFNYRKTSTVSVDSSNVILSEHLITENVDHLLVYMKTTCKWHFLQTKIFNNSRNKREI